MKESLWGYWLILLGIIIITVMILLQNYTTTNQQDYYLAREVTYAAMYDAVDYSYLKSTGELRIIKEKFVENFIRRFAESATLNKNYTVNFYSIYETPPAVSIEIKTNTGEFLVGDEKINAGITTRLTAILETRNPQNNSADSNELLIYSMPYGKCEAGKTCEYIYDSQELKLSNDKKNYNVVNYIGSIKNNNDISSYYNNFGTTFNYNNYEGVVLKNDVDEEYLADIIDVSDVLINNNKLSYKVKYKCNKVYSEGYENKSYYNGCLIGLKFKLESEG